MANPIQTYPTRNRFPVIGTRNVTYFASDTSVEYIWNGTGYVPQNLFVKRVGNNNPNSQGDVALPIETVASTTTTFRKAETKAAIDDTDKIILLPPTGNIFSVAWSYLKTIFEQLINKQDSLAPDGTGTKYPTVDAVNDGLDDKQDKRIVVSANTTAAIDGAYTLVANATFTDPTPQEGKGFSVLIRNGTATIGATAYSTSGTTVWRIFHSGAWANYVNELALGFTPENVANKATDFTTIDNTLYPSVEAVENRILQAGTNLYITTGDQTRTVNTPVDIVGLSFTIEPNKRYSIHGRISIGCNNTGGVQLALTVPGTSTMIFGYTGLSNTTTAFLTSRSSTPAALSTAMNTQNRTNNPIDIYVEVTSDATGGTCSFQFQPAVNTQTATIYQLNTYLTIVELP